MKIEHYLKAFIVETSLQDEHVYRALEKSNNFDSGELEKLERFKTILLNYKNKMGYLVAVNQDCLPHLRKMNTDEDYDLIESVWTTSGDMRNPIDRINSVVSHYTDSLQTAKMVDLLNSYKNETDEQKKLIIQAKIDNYKSTLYRSSVRVRPDVEVKNYFLENISEQAKNRKQKYSLGPRYRRFNTKISGEFFGEFIFAGQMLTVMGKSGTGKSTTLFNFAASCIEAGYRCCFVATEQTQYEAMTGIYRCLLHITQKEWEHSITTQGWLERKFMEKSGAKFSLFGEGSPNDNWRLPAVISMGQSSTVSEMESEIQKIQENEGKFDVIFVDYPAKLRIKPIDQYTRYGDYGEEAQVWDELGSMSKRNDWVTMTAVQVNRSGLGRETRLEPEMLGGSIRAYEISAYFLTSDRIHAELKADEYTEMTCKKDRNTGRGVDEKTSLRYDIRYNLLTEMDYNPE